MRKIIGYIRELVDGLGPPPGTVNVSATANNGDGEAELDVATHDLGVLTVEHLAESGDIRLADNAGRFGWSFELSPGQIDVQVNPTDPAAEIRWRFPDESAQVGMGFHSDIGKLGWAAGQDCLIWNAIPGGDDPSPPSWGFDPSQTWNVGNGSIASFDDGGKVTIRPFIAFVGGALFSVEGGNLQVPVGGPAGTANTSESQRWDLLQLVVNIDKTSLEYGKQTIQITQGTPGAGIPESTNPTATERRFTLHAMLMGPGSSVYSQAYDLRSWGGTSEALNPPVASNVSRSTNVPQKITWGQTAIASLLNSGLASNEVRLPSNRAYTGMAIWTGEVFAYGLTGNTERLTVKLTSEARDVNGAAVAGTDYVIQPYPTGHFVAAVSLTNYMQTASLVWPISIIPGFHVASQISAASRAWNRLRFGVAFSYTGPSHVSGGQFWIVNQSLLVNLWPIG